MRLLPMIAALGGVMSGIWGLGTSGSQVLAQDQPRREPAAQQRLVAVLELYTSQGCSSCPAADALLQAYTQRNGVVALTFPVDIWDYLGWRDTLANPKFTARQKYYAKHRGDGRVYTPQVVVNGVSHVVGSSARDIDNAIAATAQKLAKVNVPVTARIEAGRLVVEAGPAAPGAEVKDATIWLGIVKSKVEVAVRGGENRGKTLTYYNVVREMTPVGMWSGKPLDIRLDIDTVKLPDTDRAVVIVQFGKAGPILGAALVPKI